MIFRVARGVKSEGGSRTGRRRGVLVGYVSDERYVALADVADRVRAGRRERRGGALDAARGGLRRARAGPYRVTLVQARVRLQERRRWTVDPDRPYQFRLLSDGLLGLRLAEVGADRRALGVPRPRRRAVPPHPLALRPEEGVRQAARLVRRARPAGDDADHARRRLHPDRRRLEQARLRQPAPHPVRHRPGALGALLPPRQDRVGPLLRVPLGRRAGAAHRHDRRARLDHHLERLQQLRRPQQLHQRRRAAADPDRQRPAGPARATPRPTSFSEWDAPDDAYPPLSFERPEPFNHIPRARARRPTRSRAGRPATSPRPSGGSWPGWSARASATTSTPRPAARRHARPRRLHAS